jgi:hypothetical protein
VWFRLQEERKSIEKDDSGNTGRHGETGIANWFFQKTEYALEQGRNQPENQTRDYPNKAVNQKGPEEHIINGGHARCMPHSNLNQKEGQPSYPPDKCTLEHGTA